MQTNEYPEIRNGLTNYLFACLKAIDNKNELESKHILVSILEEEALKLAKNDNGNIELFAAKPMIKAVIQIFKNKTTELKSLRMEDNKLNSQIAAQIESYESIIKLLESSIVKINLK